jgi:hypothetical protein
MILIIPEPEDGTPIETVVKEVEQTLKDELNTLKLELNEKKTERYYDIAEFIQNVEPDALLQQIGDEYNDLVNRLWILDSASRNQFIKDFGNEDLWWYYVQLYCRCLQKIGLYVMPSLLSRWIHRYLFDSHRRTRDLKGNNELNIKELPSEDTDIAIQDWSMIFHRQNPEWTGDRKKLHTKIIDLFFDTWNTLNSVSLLPPVVQRQMETRLRFVISRLGTLGFEKTADEIVQVLLSSPWVTKEPSRIIESLARQGYADELLNIFACYRDNEHEMNQYLRAVVLRSLRFLPEVYDEHWNFIVAHSMEGTLVEQLMATETWLHLSNTPGFLEQEKHVGEIREELTKSVPTRLEKNYILLLSQYDPVIPPGSDSEAWGSPEKVDTKISQDRV